MGTLRLPRPTPDAFGAEGFTGLKKFGEALDQLDAKLEQNENALHLVQAAGEYDAVLAEKADRILRAPPGTLPEGRSPDMQLLHESREWLREKQREPLAATGLPMRRPVAEALEKHVIGQESKALINLAAEQRKLKAERLILGTQQASARLMDQAARLPSRDAAELVNQHRDFLNDYVATQLMTPKQRADLEKDNRHRYWSEKARAHPEAFLAVTAPGQEFADKPDGLVDIDREQIPSYRRLAVWELEGRLAEEKRAAAEVEQARKARIANIQSDYTERLTKGVLDTDTVLRSELPAVGEGSKEHYIKLLNVRAKDAEREAVAKPIKKEPSVFLGLLQDIRAQRITTETQIEQRYARSVEDGQGIDWADTLALRKELADLRTPEGERLTKRQDEFIKGVTPSIDKSNPMMGKIDQAGRLKLFEFEVFLDQQIERARKAGKDPHQLFDPQSDEYLGRPEVLQPFQKTIQESLRDMADQLRRTPTPPAAAPPNKAQRRPGETIEQYLKRRGG